MEYSLGILITMIAGMIFWFYLPKLRALISYCYLCIIGIILGLILQPYRISRIIADFTQFLN